MNELLIQNIRNNFNINGCSKDDIERINSCKENLNKFQNILDQIISKIKDENLWLFSQDEIDDEIRIRLKEYIEDQKNISPFQKITMNKQHKAIVLKNWEYENHKFFIDISFSTQNVCIGIYEKKYDENEEYTDSINCCNKYFGNILTNHDFETKTNTAVNRVIKKIQPIRNQNALDQLKTDISSLLQELKELDDNKNNIKQ